MRISLPSFAPSLPLAGSLRQSECQPGRDAVIVLSHGFAESQFGSPANALGNRLVLNDRNYEVIGVMPPRFYVKSWFPASTQAWVPLALTDEERKVRGNHNFLVIARLRPGVSVAKAQSAMTVISDRLAQAYPEEDKGWGAIVNPLARGPRG